MKIHSGLNGATAWRSALLASVAALSLMAGPALAGSPSTSGSIKQTQLTPEQIKTLDQWTTSLALQAANWGAPLVTMYNLRHNDAVGPHAKAKVNDIWRMENTSTPQLSKEAGYVTPNVNVVYGFGFMDLGPEPVILSVPDSDNLYYMVEIVDMYTNAFAYVGGKATGYKGGKFALVGPGWTGTLPDNVTRIDAPTRWILLQPRVHLYKDGKVVLDTSRKILDQITTTGLAAFNGETPVKLPAYNYAAPDVKDPNQPVSALDFKDPLQFWEIFSNAMNENPPPDSQIEALLPSFSALGIELGKKWDRTKVDPQTLSVMSKAAVEIAPMLNDLPFGWFYQGAYIPPATIGNSQTDYRTRAKIARIGLTANTPYEAVYFQYIVDENAKPLSGAKKYTMTFKEDLPYIKPGFWSLTMYDGSNNYTVENPINRYMVGSDTADLKKNEDGSFTIYIQAESPGKDKESNWLPAPKGAFYLIPRSYAPAPETIGILKDPTSWPVPAVVEVKN